MELLFNSAFEL